MSSTDIFLKRILQYSFQSLSSLISFSSSTSPVIMRFVEKLSIKEVKKETLLPVSAKCRSSRPLKVAVQFSCFLYPSLHNQYMFLMLLKFSKMLEIPISKFYTTCMRTRTRNNMYPFHHKWLSSLCRIGWNKLFPSLETVWWHLLSSLHLALCRDVLSGRVCGKLS